MERRLFGSEARIGANQELLELLFGAGLANEKSSKERRKKAQGNAHNAGVRQRKERRSLNQMALGGGNVRRVDAHDRGTQNDEQDTGNETHAQPANRARRGKTAPENAEHDHRKICAGGDGERQAYQERHIDRLKLNREENGQGADDE